MRTGRPARPLLAFALFIAVASTAGAQDSLDTLAQELIQLRGEVQELHNELESAKEQHKSQMGSLEQQRGELQAERNRLQLQIRKLKDELEKNRRLAKEAGVGAEELKPVVLEAIANRREEIGALLPFKVEERLAELNDLEKQVKTGVVNPHRAVNRLWGFYEDEIRLTSENGIYRQTIPVNGDERLTDVARIGMVMMFFRTSEGRYGKVVDGAGDGWRYEIIDSERDADRVEQLFDAMEKQIRTGYFVLPNTLGQVGG